MGSTLRNLYVLWLQSGLRMLDKDVSFQARFLFSSMRTVRALVFRLLTTLVFLVLMKSPFVCILLATYVAYKLAGVTRLDC